jgi:hypothetical protein
MSRSHLVNSFSEWSMFRNHLTIYQADQSFMRLLVLISKLRTYQHSFYEEFPVKDSATYFKGFR